MAIIVKLRLYLWGHVMCIVRIAPKYRNNIIDGDMIAWRLLVGKNVVDGGRFCQNFIPDMAYLSPMPGHGLAVGCRI